MYLKKIIIVLFLILIANTEWIFISMNYSVFAKLKEIHNEPIVNNQDEFLKEISQGIPVDQNDENLEISTPVHLNDILKNKKKFYPEIIDIPAIDIQAPVFNSNRNIENLLNRGVVNFSHNKKAFYIFGHSSSKIETPYSYIFTKITHLKTGDIVSLKSGNQRKIYKYIGDMYKKPEKLDELKDDEDKLYLITCYPFNTSITRYVVQFEYIETINE